MTFVEYSISVILLDMKCWPTRKAIGIQNAHLVKTVSRKRPTPDLLLCEFGIIIILPMEADICTSALQTPVDLAEYLFKRLYQLGVRVIQGVPGVYILYLGSGCSGC
jgi:hypothetical protein